MDCHLISNVSANAVSAVAICVSCCGSDGGELLFHLRDGVCPGGRGCCDSEGCVRRGEATARIGGVVISNCGFFNSAVSVVALAVFRHRWLGCWGGGVEHLLFMSVSMVGAVSCSTCSAVQCLARGVVYGNLNNASQICLHEKSIVLRRVNKTSKEVYVR